MTNGKFCTRCGNSCLDTVIICNKCGGKSFSSESLSALATPTSRQRSYREKKSYVSSAGETQRSLVTDVSGRIKRNKAGSLFIGLGIIMTLSIIYSVSWGGKQKFFGSVETLQRGLSGHFHAKVWINGTPLEMLIDTGATKVSLSLKQAIRLGISKEQLGTIHAVQTANGTVRAADIILKQVRLGSIVAKDVDAWVILSKNEGEMALLGMSFLNRLSSWSRSGSTLSLEP